MLSRYRSIVIRYCENCGVAERVEHMANVYVSRYKCFMMLCLICQKEMYS